MNLNYNIIHDSFKLNGKSFSLTESNNPFEKEITEFIKQWQNENLYITLKTSGSTGKPKAIKMSKQAMINSALATGHYFNLKQGDSALLCLPINYIAGKMMLVRAMVLGLKIDCVNPKLNLSINENKTYKFVAMVPLQLQKNINKLQNIKHLIIGGAKVSQGVVNSIQNLKTKIYETYGMTETVSHIAIKPLNISKHNTQQCFNTIPNVTIALDNRGCLVIDVPSISKEKIITNDIVKLHSKTEFEWLGRYDNVINSGGIKIYPEQIENQLSSKINARFFIASEQNDELGEQVILVVEEKEGSVNTTVFNDLETYSKPKKIYYLDAFIETTSGKIQRKKTLELL